MFNFDEKCKNAMKKINKFHKKHQNSNLQKNWKNYVIVKN